MLICTLFEGVLGFEKVYVLYTHLNIDNYGRPLSYNPIYIVTCFMQFYFQRHFLVTPLFANSCVIIKLWFFIAHIKIKDRNSGRYIPPTHSQTCKPTSKLCLSTSRSRGHMTSLIFILT